MTTELLTAYPNEEYVLKSAPGNGCVSLFFLPIFMFAALCATGALGSNYGDITGYIVGTVAVLITLFWIIMLIRQKRLRAAQRTGVDVLRSILDFRLDIEFYDVGLTAFCRPDSAAPGDNVSMLIFAQNYSNRPRRVFLTMSNSAVFGELAQQKLQWDLSPGQCVVFRTCLTVPQDIAPNSYEPTIRAVVKSTKGQGARLIPRLKSRSAVMLTRPRRISVGLTVTENQGFRQDNISAPPPDQLLSLYIPSLDEPRFDILQQITQASPYDIIQTDPL